MTTPPNLGLLLDVDGPIASPVTRSIRAPGLLDSLVALAGAGVPIAFVTGRSDAFVREQVVAPLLDAGLGDALERPGTRMFGVFEKGAVWAEITPTGLGEVHVDESVAPGPDAVRAIRDLVARDYAETMFVDETKRAMISVEQRTDVDSDAFLAVQPQFETDAFDAIAALGLGIRFEDRVAPDQDGETPFRVDPTIIATDVESVLLDKDRGAERALAAFAQRGPLPARWRTAGDSRSDYLMADHLHAAGYDVAHLDVRPSDGVLDRPYEILTVDGVIHDDAGARFLADLRSSLGA